MNHKKLTALRARIGAMNSLIIALCAAGEGADKYVDWDMWNRSVEDLKVLDYSLPKSPTHSEIEFQRAMGRL